MYVCMALLLERTKNNNHSMLVGVRREKLSNFPFFLFLRNSYSLIYSVFIFYVLESNSNLMECTLFIFDKGFTGEKDNRCKLFLTLVNPILIIRLRHGISRLFLPFESSLFHPSHSNRSISYHGQQLTRVMSLILTNLR